MKKLKKIAKGVAIGTIGLGAISEAMPNTEIALKAKQGMQNFAGSFPKVGTIIGAGLVIGTLKEFEKTTKKFRR